MTIPLNFLQATINFEGLNVPQGAAVVFGCARNIELTASEHADIIQDAFADAFAPEISTSVTITTCDVKFGPDATGASGTSSVVPRQGAQSAACLAPNTAFLLTKVTGTGGRRGRGRMFLPGVTDTLADNGGVVLPAVVTQLGVRGTQLLTALDVAGMPMVVLHEPSTIWVLVNGQPRRIPTSDPLPEPDQVTSLVCNTRVGTQRRRLR